MTLKDNKKLMKGCTEDSDGIKVDIKSATITITLTFDKNQSGRQGKVKLLTSKDIGTVESGEVDIGKIEGSSLNTPTYTYSGKLPSVCGGKGLCNKDTNDHNVNLIETGKCNCGDEYTGYTCEIPLPSDTD